MTKVALAPVMSEHAATTSNTACNEEKRAMMPYTSDAKMWYEISQRVNCLQTREASMPAAPLSSRHKYHASHHGCGNILVIHLE